MTKEDTRRGKGFSKVPPPEEPREVVAVETTDGDDAAEASEIVEAEEVQPALTVGDIVEGTKDVAGSIGTYAKRMIDRGRYRKVRITRKGKQVLPDIPVAAAAALEAASMYGAGIARILALNVGAKFFFDVEIVNEADKYFERGKQAVLDGDLDRALEALEKAVRIDDQHAGAFLQLGVLFRLRGDKERARVMLARAKELDQLGDTGRRAEEILRALELPTRE